MRCLRGLSVSERRESWRVLRLSTFYCIGSSTHRRIAKSFSMAADAMTRRVGCDYQPRQFSTCKTDSERTQRTATAITTSAEIIQCGVLNVGKEGRPTSMPLEYLHDLSSLEVPKVYLHIFASAHDMLAPRSEVGKYAVRPIGVTGVGLDALRRLGRPETNSRVLGTR